METYPHPPEMETTADVSHSMQDNNVLPVQGMGHKAQGPKI